MANDREFVNGLFMNKPREQAPDFVVADGSINRQRMIDWLNGRDEEWINIQMNTPKNINPEKPRRLTVFIDDYKKDEQKQQNLTGETDEFDDDIPF